MSACSVMINVPRGRRGGVANYYAGLASAFPDHVVYNGTGGHHGRVLFPLFMLADYLVFAWKLAVRRPGIVHLNPSLDRASTVREGLFLLIAKLFRRRVIVFWRGWDEEVAAGIERGRPALFTRVYSRADAFIVLAGEFAEALRRWGMTQPIHLETTQVDERLLEDFRIEDKRYAGRRILFMARLERSKGVFETIEAVRALGREDLELVVAGSGPVLEEARRLVAAYGMRNVSFPGYATGEAKAAALREADLYVFPTSHGEGMPNSVLEAMAFGLPVITRPVGGVRDFFEDGRMGFLTESRNPEDYARLIARVLDDPELMAAIGLYNYRYAERRFRSSRVAARLLEIYRKTQADR